MLNPFRYGRIAGHDSEMGVHRQEAPVAHRPGAVGMLACGFLSSRGNIWERFTIASAFGTFGSMIAAGGMALVYYVKIRFELHTLVRCRAPLTDQDFISLSPRLKGVDRFVVHRVRQAAARQFRAIGGDRFHPEDDLETDLHLPDLSFWGEWLESVTDDLGIEEGELARELESGPIQTYGDLVLLFDQARRKSKGVKTPSDNVRSHPVWDRAIDG